MFSEALARHPKVFTRLYLSMVIAGETAGMLESTLTRLADFMKIYADESAALKGGEAT